MREEKDLVECGKLGRAVGLKGENLVVWYGESCPVNEGGEIVALLRDGKTRSFNVAALRRQGRLSVILFGGISSRNDASKLTNSRLFVRKAALSPLKPGEYYTYQIVGMEVVTDDGRSLGIVVKIFTAGENDVYEVMPAGGKPGDEMLIPAIADVITKIDINAGLITVKLLEGMD
jgi:16S rRNA processing protein RimM